ncbi:hypothetical protein ACFLZ6_01415 [Nanoarchaeota archaeon]
MDKRIGNYSFIGGVVLAVILGLPISLGTAATWLTSLLVLLGLTVGFLNVAGKDVKEFLILATILVIVSSMGATTGVLAKIQVIGSALQGILGSIMNFVVPATIIVALKAVYGLTKKSK